MSSPANPIVLTVEHQQVVAADGTPIVEDVSFDLRAGEILGIVGESGSGKTTTALALLGYTHGGARITSGHVEVADQRIEMADHRAARSIRGKVVSYVPQNPGTALNPSTRIGDAIGRMVAAHRRGDAPDDVVATALETVALDSGTEFQRRYPHQLSGGQQQRVCISVALVGEPAVVILDEPTTGLDVVTQARILDELTRLCREQSLAMLYVTHDLAVVAQIADRIAVMYAGRLVECGPAPEVLRRPRHPYTRGLITSIPDHVKPSVLEPMPGVAVGIEERPPGCAFAPRCVMAVEACVETLPELRVVDAAHTARCLRAEEVERPSRPALRISEVAPAAPPTAPVLEVQQLRAVHRGRHETVVAAEDVSFAIRAGQCVALVGESGSGKTTIARAVGGLHPLDAGKVLLNGAVLPDLARKRTTESRRNVQIIFQNPADALNPRQTVRSAVARPARVLRDLSKSDADAEVARLLDLVRLPARLADRYPAELSGGERQRIGIARALAAKPDVIICDEITSALDVSVQAAVLKLLAELRDELGLALLFITHDLGVVATVADEVLVLERGHVCEAGPTGAVLKHPTQPYTQRLLESAPSISHALELWDAYEADQRPAVPDEPSTR